MSVKIRGRYPALAALVLAAAVVPSTAFATGPIQDPIAIGPNMPFVGLVNGVSSDAVITLACLGPITPGETGHPMAGQTVEVETVLPVTSVDGNTGSAGKSIDVYLGADTAANINPPIVFTSFFVKEPIPTTDVFPCSGSGVASFVPLPTSATARDYTMSIAFGNITAG